MGDSGSIVVVPLARQAITLSNVIRRPNTVSSLSRAMQERDSQALAAIIDECFSIHQ